MLCFFINQTIFFNNFGHTDVLSGNILAFYLAYIQAVHLAVEVHGSSLSSGGRRLAVLTAIMTQVNIHDLYMSLGKHHLKSVTAGVQVRCDKCDGKHPTARPGRRLYCGLEGSRSGRDCWDVKRLNIQKNKSNKGD